MEPPTTGKVVIHTTKGSLVIDLWCKECPRATRVLMEYILSEKLRGIEINNHPQYVEILVDWPQVPIQETNARLKFKRGYVGVLDDGLFICKENDVYNGFVIGKLVGDSIYNLQALENEEFKNSIKGGEVLVKYFEDIEIPQQIVQVEEVIKIERPKKKRIKLDYAVEDDGFTMKSIYDVTRSKEQKEKEKQREEKEEREEEKEKEDEEDKGNEEKNKKDIDQIERDKDQEEKDQNQEEKKTKQETSQEINHIQNSSDDVIIPNSRPFDKYKDIPMEILRNHKYIRTRMTS